ncbi:hypothetical protein QH494_27800 [Sphingomonas sp. AR_OL41]|nr:hypothetical protein [Sphingomonas sp. AR_OL41]
MAHAESRHAPRDDLAGRLTFALRYEGVNLPVLAQLFRAVAPADIGPLVAACPTGSYARLIWFLYEWLTGSRPSLPDAGPARAVPVMDPAQQYALAKGERSPRHRVINNLPGTAAFCPMVRRTAALDARSVGTPRPVKLLG